MWIWVRLGAMSVKCVFGGLTGLSREQILGSRGVGPTAWCRSAATLCRLSIIRKLDTTSASLTIVINRLPILLGSLTTPLG